MNLLSDKNVKNLYENSQDDENNLIDEFSLFKKNVEDKKASNEELYIQFLRFKRQRD